MTAVTVTASVRPRRRDSAWVCALWGLVPTLCLHVLLFGPTLPVELAVLDLGMSVLLAVWVGARRRALARRLGVGTPHDLLVLQRRIACGEVPADPVERAALRRLVRLRQQRRWRTRRIVSLLCLLYLLVVTWMWTVVGDHVLSALTLVVAVLYAVLAGRLLRRTAARLDRIAAALGDGDGDGLGVLH
ncbi:hypothetical protein [Streptomyces sp. bgisy060]|uniref:hypothetical protein n=1 Tax=Streptomyces sp. bgisy060 TaxID=3413775 RepID=UPI003EBBF6ED